MICLGWENFPSWQPDSPDSPGQRTARIMNYWGETRAAIWETREQGKHGWSRSRSQPTQHRTATVVEIIINVAAVSVVELHWIGKCPCSPQTRDFAFVFYCHHPPSLTLLRSSWSRSSFCLDSVSTCFNLFSACSNASLVWCRSTYGETQNNKNQIEKNKFYLEVNFPLVTTDFCLISQAFVGQFLVNERLQIREESGEVGNLKYF